MSGTSDPAASPSTVMFPLRLDMKMLPQSFFAIHADVDREGPGDDASTLRALELSGLIGKGSNKPLAVADIACGPGASSVVLAQALPEGSKLTCIDYHGDFVRHAERRIKEMTGEGKARVEVEFKTRSMNDLDDILPAQGLDLIWCEGAGACPWCTHMLI